MKESFFDEDKMVVLESMPDGYLYSNILLKLYLKSIKNNGKLMFNDCIPYNPQMIATITRHPVGVVEKAIRIFEKIGIIDILDNGTIYMLDIQEYIGKTSTESDRKREYRRKIEEDKRKQIGHLSGQYDPEIEIDIDIDKEKEKNTLVDSAKSTCEKEEKYCEELTLLQKERTNFETIYKEYPKKAGKAKAFDYYRQWIKGRKMSTGTQKLENIQIYRAVKKYVGQMEEKNTEIQYYKNFDTFMNKAILDYLEE
jgi:predicted phage replisome organizer